MNTISVTIDLGKLDKSRVTTRTYTNRNGETITVKELKLDIVPLREPKVVTIGDNWSMVKTHFVAHQKTAEEKANKQKAPIIGDGVQFEPIGQEQEPDPYADIPF